jgi:hypothetical protein
MQAMEADIMNSGVRRTLALLGVLMIGDAAAYALGPKRYVRVWSWAKAPRWYKRMMEAASNKRLGALLGTTEAIIGLGAIRLAERA